jgi:hypothetical protein
VLRDVRSIAAALLAAAALYAGIHWGAIVAGGADSYGYVSQAGLLVQKRLEIQQELARTSPWPSPLDTWTPLGYRDAPDRADAIVPLYPPGLPLLMALFQLAGGFCAAFLVVPIFGALTILLTYALGRRLFANPSIAIAAAVFVATSPVFLYQLMNPMTDVPVTAAWAFATLLVAMGYPTGAGLAASAAILIRPNLVLLVIALAVFVKPRWRFIAGAFPAVAIVAALNTRLYGAPWLAGYGAPGELYALRYFPTNLRQFTWWTFETQTPVVLLALVPLIRRRREDAPHSGAGLLLLAALACAVAASYLFYIPFDAWWYLRFLLPMWPMMMLLLAAAPERMFRTARTARVGLAIIGFVLVTHGLRTAIARSAFDLGRGERRYVDVARFVRERTEPTAVPIAVQHSGSLRLYAGRTTLRYDQLDPRWLDRAVAFLAEHGRHPYVVVDGDEAEAFRRRFAGANELGRLDWKPMAVLEASHIAIYDPLDRRSTAEPLAITSTARRAGWRCEMPYVWPPPLRIE